MREIKFRVWNKNDEEMYNNRLLEKSTKYRIEGYIENGIYLDLGEKDFIHMQYTGINDINGNEIYEGDIVTSESTHPGFGSYCKGVVKFYEGTYYIENKGTGNIIPLFDETNEINVVGNIYENPLRLY